MLILRSDSNSPTHTSLMAYLTSVNSFCQTGILGHSGVILLITIKVSAQECVYDEEILLYR